ncbi:hypothetical protein EG68_06624 [Paragonimus skrjabini miyazakii]|uniref:FERM domain-containing protein n=1 Tax=Paragonimus skrjabini miyazakii TaxID=59628 RepID=A0A8S9YCM5_9TREM|nr:hypothetical protein EG68_06624 [Paragonimus skrjabini miyazakii]
MEEREYFGLRYLEHEMRSPPTKQWVDITRGLFVQLKNTTPRVVSFRIKHYPAEPMVDLKLPKTFYLLYRQLRRDLVSGRLVAASEEMVRLAALVVQVELGDCSMQDLPQISTKTDAERTYLADFQVLHNQTKRTEALILEEHKKLEGLLPSEAATEMIQLASSLETYGVDPIRVKTKAYGSRPIHLGLTHRGVAEFVSNRCQKLYLWSNISWMTCDGRHFILAVRKQTSGRKKQPHLNNLFRSLLQLVFLRFTQLIFPSGSVSQLVETIHFKCETKAVARALWEWASDRQLFLTLEKSSSAKLIKSKPGLFSRTLTFKFSGRCRREILGRPSVAATLPADLSVCPSDVIDNFHSDHVKPSAAAHSISMVALTNDALAPEFAMQPIGERDSVEEGEGWNNVNTIKHNREPLAANSGSFCRSHVSAFNSALSEPTASRQPMFSSEEESKENVECQVRQLGDVVQLPANVHQEQLVGFFKELPRRRYAPEAQLKQRKLERAQRRHRSGELRNPDIFDSDIEEDDDLSTGAAIAELHAVAEAGRVWATGAPNSMPQVNSDPVGASGSAVKPQDSSLALVTSENDSSTVSGWRILAISAGFLTGASVIGMALLLETDVHSPLTAAIREHPWVLDFDARYYRPVRVALSNFWRR